jgi:hypothetical protein
MTTAEHTWTSLTKKKQSMVLHSLGFLRFYETILRKKNTNSKILTYTVKDVFEFIELLSDLALLVYPPYQIRT